jgi:integrase
MPKLDKRLTTTSATALPLPSAAGPRTKEIIKGAAASLRKSVQVFHWCKDTPGFGVRLSSSGDRSYVSERRVDGKTVRRTLGKAAGPGAISADAARKLMLTVSSELQTGFDRVEVKREKATAERQEGITFSAALTEYVKGKRRGKDGLALKDRTKFDYLLMVAEGGKTKAGKPYANGALFDLAEKSIYKITPADIKTAYISAEAKSQRQATYAMQVLRAVLNWHGVAVEGSPLAKGTAGKDRIILAGTAGDPKPIPPEKLSAWWQAASAMDGQAGADGLRLILLTGCRPGEVFGSHDYQNGQTVVFTKGLLVQDVDLDGGRMMLHDTKNRKDHTVVLSTQALAIVQHHCAGKKPAATVFSITDPRKALDAINAAAGVVGITPHKLRHTFASVAEELVSGYALKRMLNHTEAGDVTGTNYVGKSENQLRVAWQTVADFISSPTARVPSSQKQRSTASTSRVTKVKRGGSDQRQNSLSSKQGGVT